MGHVVQAFGGRDLPPARDFILSAGFAGLAAVIAAAIALCAVLWGSRRASKRAAAERAQSERHHAELRADAQRAVAVARCWDRWWQVLETAALEPAASEGATLGLGPEVALTVVRGLLRDAEELGDDTLAKAVAVYQEQFLLVLAQQSGPLSALVAEPTAPADGGSDNARAPGTPGSTGQRPGVAKSAADEPGQRAAADAATADVEEPVRAETSSAAPQPATGRRQRS
jgi:hypothetical protein